MRIVERIARTPSLTALSALALGVASAFAFEPVGLWLLMPLAFTVLLALLAHRKTVWGALLLGYLFGLGQFVVGLNWIATAFTFQAKMPPSLGWLAVVLLSIYLAVYPAMATAIAWRIGRDERLRLVLALAGCWVICEWLRGWVFTGFPWNPVAATLAPTPLITTSALIGTYGLSGLVVLLGGAVWLELAKRWLPTVLILGGSALLWLLPGANIPDGLSLAKAVRVVQPNIGQQDKWDPAFEAEAAQRLALISNQPGGQRPRLLLWPEAAVTEPLVDNRPGPPAAFAEFERKRASALLQPGEFLLTGGIALRSSDGQSIAGASNSVFALGPSGQLVGRYDKAHLVPYGEYLPMRPLLSVLGLSRLAPGDEDFDSGPGPRTIDLPGWGRVGFQLCYEIIFSGHVVDEHQRPDFIFNPSNDAWFGRWGPPQHLAQARLRAAEEGIPVIRSTPTGISAIVDAHGEVVKQLQWRKPGIIDGVVPPSALGPTAFARFGNLIPLLLALAFIGGAIALGRSERYRRT
jgi:apolipoprotein N-acyltransferase